MFLILLVAVSAILVIKIVIVAIDTISVVIYIFYINIRLYPLVLNIIKLKLTSPLLSFGSI